MAKKGYTIMKESLSSSRWVNSLSIGFDKRGKRDVGYEGVIWRMVVVSIVISEEEAMWTTIGLSEWIVVVIRTDEGRISCIMEKASPSL